MTFLIVDPLFTESQKAKTNGDKSSQPKTNSTTKVNGEESITSDSNTKIENLSTKEPLLNGTDNNCEKVVNGDPKKHLDCDISSSSDNTKVVTNGINSDSDDAKSCKSEENENVCINICPNKISQGKQVTEKKKEKKTKATDKSSESDKKKDTGKDKAKEDQKEDSKSKRIDNLSDKVNGESKVLNGDKNRESSPSEDGDEKKRDAEVVFIQDMGFTVKIVSPGAEPLDIQVCKLLTDNL